MRRLTADDLALAIAEAGNRTSFGRAWMTAIGNEDGTVTTTAHATANYDHRGEQRECHIAFEVVADEAIEAAFKATIAANARELVMRAMRDATMLTVSASNHTDIIGKAGHE